MFIFDGLKNMVALSWVFADMVGVSFGVYETCWGGPGYLQMLLGGLDTYIYIYIYKHPLRLPQLVDFGGPTTNCD